MISLSNITVQYGSQILFANAGMQINPGERIGLVGANGTGKTTVFRIIAGEQGLDTGELVCGKKTVVGYFSQDVGEMRGRSAVEEVMAVAHDVVRLGAEIKTMEEAMGSQHGEEEMAALLTRYGEALEAFDNRGGYDLENRAQTVLTGLGIGPDEYHRPVESFSGGWKMRIALARILTLNPDVLLLDEPTNHLDLESIIWLEEWLSSEFKGALLMTSHDREFMNRAVNRIIEIANRTITTYSGNYDFYLQDREIRKEQLLASHRRQQEMLAKEQEFIARFAARASHASQVQSRIKKIDKIERIEIPEQEKTIRFTFTQPPRSGDEVAKFEGLGKRWLLPDNQEKSVFSGVSGLIRRQEKIAVVGVNGAGKSTFLKILSGQTDPTEGTVSLGANVLMGYFSQHAADILAPSMSVFETVQTHLPMASIGVIRNLCAAFLFRGDAVDKKVSTLSGGEKSRLVLATMLARPINFLVLDEPTNHLDIGSREILLEALTAFTGTVILVSHDRHFLRSLATRVFEVDRGEMRIFEGNYDYYLSRERGGR